MAAVAVTGGAFAQATLTGGVAFGYTQRALAATSGGTGAINSGMGADGAWLDFGASEELDGGVKLATSIGIDTGVSGVTSAGRDAYITASGGFGTVQIGSVKGGSYLSGGVAGAGAAKNSGLDGLVLPSRSAKDTVNWTIPLMDGLKAKIDAEENDVVGGTGTAGSTAQRRTTYSLTYAAGALTVTGGYRSFDQQGTGSSETLYASGTRAAASYDMGVAKIGFGVENYTAPYGNTRNSTLVGLNVPLGALSIGAQLATNTTAGSATAANNQTLNAALLAASYSVSKRTTLIAEYVQSDVGYVSSAGATAFVTTTSAYTAAGTYGKQNFTGVYIYHSF